MRILWSMHDAHIAASSSHPARETDHTAWNPRWEHYSHDTHSQYAHLDVYIVNPYMGKLGTRRCLYRHEGAAIHQPSQSCSVHITVYVRHLSQPLGSRVSALIVAGLPRRAVFFVAGLPRRASITITASAANSTGQSLFCTCRCSPLSWRRSGSAPRSVRTSIFLDQDLQSAGSRCQRSRDALVQSHEPLAALGCILRFGFLFYAFAGLSFGSPRNSASSYRRLCVFSPVVISSVSLLSVHDEASPTAARANKIDFACAAGIAKRSALSTGSMSLDTAPQGAGLLLVLLAWLFQ